MAIVKVTIEEEDFTGRTIDQNPKWNRRVTNHFVVGDSTLPPTSGSGLAVKIRSILSEHNLRVRNVEDW